jgi:hypothetical protein
MYRRRYGTKFCLSVCTCATLKVLFEPVTWHKGSALSSSQWYGVLVSVNVHYILKLPFVITLSVVVCCERFCIVSRRPALIAVRRNVRGLVCSMLFTTRNPVCIFLAVGAELMVQYVNEESGIYFVTSVKWVSLFPRVGSTIVYCTAAQVLHLFERKRYIFLLIGFKQNGYHCSVLKPLFNGCHPKSFLGCRVKSFTI